MIPTAFGLFKSSSPTAPAVTAEAPAITSDERTAAVVQIQAEEAAWGETSVQLERARIAACEREARAEELRREASAERARCEVQQLTASLCHDQRLGILRRRLITGAPPELERLARSVAAVADQARGLVQTREWRGHENLLGHRPMQASTNAAEVQAVLALAARICADLEAAKLEAVMPALGPLVPLRTADQVFEVPAELAEAFAAIGGVSSGALDLSPAEARELQWRLERPRKTGRPWRE